jgi:5-methylthioadenosine/S-adenosylhomocysteine deaminase
MSLLIHNCAYLVCSPAQIERDCDVFIEGTRIAAIGRDLTVPPGVEVIDAAGCVVIPGLVNAHTHLYQNLIKGTAAGLPLVPWCNEVLFRCLDALRPALYDGRERIAYLWSALAAIEMIRGGVTSCIDMDLVHREVLLAWKDVGFRGVLAYTLANRWVPADIRNPEELMRQEALDFIDEFHQPDGLTTVCLAPSTLFLCSDDFLRWAGQVAHRRGLGLQIHIAETAGEVEDLLRETGDRPVEHLQRVGLLDERLSAVHCVHLDAHEIDLLAASGASMVHCPKSNMKLADGIAPVVPMLRRGTPVSVATDGCASNDLLDMWEEMRAALLLARVSQNDADALSPQEAFAMATATAARAARLDAGTLAPGKLADLAILDIRSAHLQPFNADDLLNMLVFCARAADVRDTIIHGQVVMRERRITRVDEAALIAETAALSNQIFQKQAAGAARS